LFEGLILFGWFGSVAWQNLFAGNYRLNRKVNNRLGEGSFQIVNAKCPRGIIWLNWNNII